MIKNIKFFSLVTLLTLTLSTGNALAEEQCTNEQVDALDMCVQESVTSCLASYPGCTAREVRIDEVVDNVLNRCIYKVDGETKRPVGACKACIISVSRDLRRGPSRWLWPVFTGQVVLELKDLLKSCGESEKTPDDRKEQFCEKFPNAKICAK